MNELLLQSDQARISTIRRFRDLHFPVLSKYGALKLANPFLRQTTSRSKVENRLSQAMERLGIRYLDLGGMNPAEEYLTIHLSPVELYGTVLTPEATTDVWCEDGLLHQKPRPLKSPALVVNFDVTDGIPLRDGAILGLNMSHFLEHFPLVTGLRILSECRRVLSPGGVLRVSCPDLRRYATAYVASDRGFFGSVGTQTYCSYDNLCTLGERFISKAYDNRNGHLWFYDADTLIYRLGLLGFQNAEIRRVHDSNLPQIQQIEPGYREIESFYVEAHL